MAYTNTMYPGQMWQATNNNVTFDLGNSTTSYAINYPQGYIGSLGQPQLAPPREKTPTEWLDAELDKCLIKL